MTEWKIGDGKCCIGRREGIDNEMKGRFCRGGEKIMVETWKREGYNGGRREGGPCGHGFEQDSEGIEQGFAG